MEKTFYLYWLDGKKEIIVGNDIFDAFMKAGYGGGALSALDFFNTKDENYIWDKENRTWKKEEK